MKKTLIISTILLLAGISLAANAAVNYTALKQTITVGLDACISLINSVESKIVNNSQVSQETKQSVSQSLNQLESALSSYKNQVQSAATLQDLQAINQQIINYLKTNSSVIKDSIKTAIVDMGEKAVESAEGLKQKAEQALNVLKVACPSEKTTISTLENQLVQLEAEINLLKQALSSKNAATIKQEMQKITNLSKSVAVNLKQLESVCVK